MKKLEVCEIPGGYAQRTAVNAGIAPVTVAFALNFHSAGERLTRRKVEEYHNQYIAIHLGTDEIFAAKVIATALSDADFPILNIAGNGEFTLAPYGWSQKMVDDWVYTVISNVHKIIEIKKIYTGGQTGVYLAGARAGYRLGIRTKVNMPKQYLQRGLSGEDTVHTREEIEEQIINGRCQNSKG